MNEKMRNAIVFALAEAYSAGAESVQFSGPSRCEALEAALAATGKQQGGEVQGDALLESLVTRWRKDADEVGASYDTLCQKIANCTMRHAAELQAVLAARQPVGQEPFGYCSDFEPGAYEFSHTFYYLGPGEEVPAGCTAFYAATPAQGIDLSPIATRKLAELAAQGYVTNGVAIFNPATDHRGLVDNLGFVGWMGGKRDAGAGVES